MELSKIITLEDVIEENNVAKLAAIIRKTNIAKLHCSGFSINLDEKETLPFDFYDIPLIHLAAYYDSSECLSFLLQNNIYDADQKTSKDVHPLHYAICNNSLECLTLLLERGADPNHRPYNTDLTPLFLAARYGNVDAVKVLIGKRASLEYKIGDPSPIAEAIRCKNIDCFNYLINNGFKLNEYTQKTEHSPLLWAITNELTDIIPFLMENGANVNSLSKYGLCPLYLACQHRNLKAVQYLSSSPKLLYNICCANSYPIHWAAESCVPDIVRHVINHGANVNALNCRGETAISYALRFDIRKGKESYERNVSDLIETLSILVEHGLDFNTRCNDGSFPIYDYINGPKCNKRVLSYIFSVGINLNLNCRSKKYRTLGEAIFHQANASVIDYVQEKLKDFKPETVAIVVPVKTRRRRRSKVQKYQ